MTGPVTVLINESPVKVFIDADSPRVTVTDQVSQKVTVLQSQPVKVVTANDPPKVIVNTGVGSTVDANAVMSMLQDNLDLMHMNPSLANDLAMLQSLWARIGNQLELLTVAEGADISQAGRVYTDGKITDTVASLQADTDGKVSAAVSTITQTTDAIDQKISTLEQETDNTFVVHNSRILQTENTITQTVSRMDSIDGPGGDIEALDSAIRQNADGIALETVARQQVATDLTETRAELSLAKDNITQAVVKVDEVGSRQDATDLVLGENGVVITTMSEALGDARYEIGSVQEVLKNQWGVTIEEDAGGNTYAAGFKMVLHPAWLKDGVYAVDDTIYYDRKVWQCIQAHTGDLTNNPSGVNALSYWVELPEGQKSVFAVKAEEFFVQSPTGRKPMFHIDGDQVFIHTDLIVNALESVNYGDPGKTWFKLDPATGLAEFNNMAFHIGTGSSGYENLADRPTSLADINADEVAAIIADASEGKPIWQWEGTEGLNLSTDDAGADEFIFDSGVAGGVIVEVMLPDTFTGSCDFMLNGEHLTFLTWDCGTLDDAVGKVIDLSEATEETIDLGGIV